jgi:uncharacterized protein YjiS (DUF1127 family)
MTALAHDLDIDFAVDRPLPGVSFIRRLIAAWRKRRQDRRHRAILRTLSDATLIDIGVDPLSVRDGFPRITPDTGFFVPASVR